MKWRTLLTVSAGLGAAMPLISHAEVRELPPPEVRRAASVSVFFGGPGSGFVRTPNLEVTRVIAASGDCNPCNANLALFVITPAQNRPRTAPGLFCTREGDNEAE